MVLVNPAEAATLAYSLVSTQLLYIPETLLPMEKFLKIKVSGNRNESGSTLSLKSVKTVTIWGVIVLMASVTLVLSAVSKAVVSSTSVVVDSILLFRFSSAAARVRPC